MRESETVRDGKESSRTVKYCDSIVASSSGAVDVDDRDAPWFIGSPQ